MSAWRVKAMFVLCCLGTLSLPAGASEAEIEFLLQAIGQSDCTFYRNGKAYSSSDAEAHLRMKYNRTRKRVKTADQFIDRLASKSFLSGNAYSMQCARAETVPTQPWLQRTLGDYPRQAP